MKRKLLALAVVTICLAIIASGTLAYFTAEETAHNVITSGNINIEIVETQRDVETGTEIPYPDEPLGGIMPGQSVSKIVTVKNKEESAKAWIRVMVNVTGQFADGTTIMPDQLKVISFEPNETYWGFDEEEGYFYHKAPVDSGKQTAPLFKEVKFAPEMGNEFQNCTVYIDVNAEAVQYDNNPNNPDPADVDERGMHKFEQVKPVFFDKSGAPIDIEKALDALWPDDETDEPTEEPETPAEGETPDAPTGGEGETPTPEGGEPEAGEDEAPVEPEQGAEGEEPSAEPEA